ncbi:cobyrinic acid a,c-diamide synthase [Caballeronia telluris]|uniref:Cobyrinic acid a,c-diamide synthase n=2 Tax=Caballeronia telluris TaxID=326475 RepID=A0A158KGC9_9BURK|nr:cobyrinic acid a,c-diamide synthase [Caballeronia telluris]
MPTIVFISPKGGVGKTTSSLTLGTQLAKHGAAVTMIDADPNRPLKKWGKGGRKPDNLAIVSDIDEESILDAIDVAASMTPFVIVDLEGTADKIALLAVSQADLVIIPMQPSELDADQASRALKVIAQQERMARRSVPHAVLFTRTNSTIRTRTMTHIANSLREAGIPMFDTEMNEREAFRGMFSFSAPLEALDAADVANVPKAIENAERFMNEVLDTLRRNAATAEQGAA